MVEFADRQAQLQELYSPANQLMKQALEAGANGDMESARSLTKLSEIAFIAANVKNPLVEPLVIPRNTHQEITNSLEN